MGPKRWQQIVQIYHAALDREPERRLGFLAEACEGDEELYAAIESLLRKGDATPNSSTDLTVTSPATHVPAGCLIGPYRIEAALGAGGMGEVYRAHDTRLKRTVAIKVLPRDQVADPARKHRFLLEARAASALNHPNIVALYDISSDRGVDYLVLEYVRGRTLKEMCKGEASSVDVLVHCARQTAAALAAAHAAGIVHRDIKPTNIMVTPASQVKVLDFGIAKLGDPPNGSEGDETQTALHETLPGTVVGTPAYMSPEQARGEPLDGRSDVFSLGVVLYELATGRHPFLRPSGLATFQAIISATPEPPSRINPELPAGFEALLLSMLEKNRQRRPTADCVSAALTDSALLQRVALQGDQALNVVGRDREQEQLVRWYGEAAAGRGLLVCVAGEPGLGKTTLVEAFLQQVSDTIVARGRCSERLAGSEAYLPVFEILSDLSRRSQAIEASRLMQETAPTWYFQVVSLPNIDPAKHHEFRPALTQERMKQEVITFFEELCRVRPVVLFLEDLHWADVSTVDLLSYLGNRVRGMRLLLICTYRQSELLAGKHPFRQVKLELQGRNLAQELSLEFLSRPDLDQYLARTFPGHDFPSEFAEVIYSRTEGHPLFMTDLLRNLRDRALIAHQDGRWRLTSTISLIERTLPTSVQSMIERKIDLVSEEDRPLLGAAAVQGWEFDSALLARVLGMPPEHIEERLGALDNMHALVRTLGERELPDGAINIRYRFVHALYQEAFARQLTASRRVRLSLEIGQALERAYGSDSRAIVSKLAYLFEQACDFERATFYYSTAAQTAARVFGHQEVTTLARRGLGCLERLPDSSKKAADELNLQVLLGGALMTIRGFGDDDVLGPFRRARELCQRYSLAGQVTALRGVWTFHLVRGDFPIALELAHELIALAEAGDDPAVIIQGHYAGAFTGMYTGELTAGARHFEAAIAITDPREQPERTMFAIHHSVACRGQFGVLLYILGCPDRGLALARAAKVEAERRGSPYDISWAHMTIGRVHELRGEAELTLHHAEASMLLAREHGLKEVSLWALTNHAAALSQLGRAEEGLGEIRSYLKTALQIGSRINRTEGVARLAQCLIALGRYDEAFEAAMECIQSDVANGERFYEAELYRMSAECCFRRAEYEDAKARFRRALEIAQNMRARAWELRAAIGLAHVLRKEGHEPEAHQLLAPIYAWYTEGFETRDLRQAKALLDQLASE